jgi:hypothetical protein
MPVDAILIDAGWRTPAVYAACMECGLGVRPVMGFGKSSGCAQANFYDAQRSTQDKKPGDGFFTPRRCDCESRPFFDEPRPFLCAI